MQKMENMIDSYSLKWIAEKDNIDTWTVKRRYNYIPIKVTTGQSKAQFRAWNTSKDYMVKYIKLEDVLNFLSNEIDFTFVRKKNNGQNK